MRIDMDHQPPRPTRTPPLLVALLGAVTWAVERTATVLRQTTEDIERALERARKERRR